MVRDLFKETGRRASLQSYKDIQLNDLRKQKLYNKKKRTKVTLYLRSVRTKVIYLTSVRTKILKS